jgi:polyisoprenoid-binding protein YceI
LLWMGLVVSPVSVAHTRTWPIDAARSQARFSVRKLWIAHTRGTFSKLAGSLQQIAAGPGTTLAEVEVTVDVASLVMGSSNQRAGVLSPTFFDAKRYPYIRFRSDPFPLGELATGGALHGMLQLHGQHHRVRFTLAPSKCPGQPLTCAIRAHGSLSRSRFGIRAWSGIIGDRVALRLKIVLRGTAVQHRGAQAAPVDPGRSGRDLGAGASVCKITALCALFGRP